jgi:small subunit ribosomal protein S7
MPRRREVPKRDVPADPIYGSQLVTKFISTIMKDGKRSTAERIMYKALAIVQEKTQDEPSRPSRRPSRTRSPRSK